jgi:DNA-binding response OmpR family regulator
MSAPAFRPGSSGSVQLRAEKARLAEFRLRIRLNRAADRTDGVRARHDGGMGSGDAGRRPTPAARVLVVEDEASIRAAVEQALVDGGFVVGGRAHGLDLEQVLAGFRPDLVILDIMLPGRDGFHLLDVVREHTDAAVILLTARDGVDDRLRGLDGGADDYVIKPFLLAELVSRVRAVLRRRGRVPTAIQYGDLVIDEQSGTASRAGAVLELTATELRLLGYLAEQRGRTVTKNQILTQVWGYDDYDPNIVEVHVSGLRRKLESRGPRIVHTVRGLGYKLGPPESGQSA